MGGAVAVHMWRPGLDGSLRLAAHFWPAQIRSESTGRMRKSNELSGL
jgi:hypothetical protein